MTATKNPESSAWEILMNALREISEINDRLRARIKSLEKSQNQGLVAA
ncbi:MAG: hypothetical protein LBQ49_03125 [Rickettsiales bacterium]|jgi:hypothetical protein|nr:hypothetical protein [Rickettsiales bacterium]